MFARDACSPEQSRALDVLEEALPMIRDLAVAESPTLDEICVKDAKFFLPHTISTSDIPRGSGWVWNQSRAKSTILDLTKNIKMCFYKLNTRKIKSSEVVPPPHKIWIFVLHIMPSDKFYSFLWCERGFNSDIETNPSIDDLSLEEFAFLKPFISAELAESLGW